MGSAPSRVPKGAKPTTSNASLLTLSPTISTATERDVSLFLAEDWSHGGFKGGGALGARTLMNVSHADVNAWRDAAAAARPLHTAAATCAVVGSSFALLNKQHGSQIDAADSVIRMNNAPAWPHAYVGARTSIYVNTFPVLRPLKRGTPKARIPIPLSQLRAHIVDGCYPPHASEWTASGRPAGNTATNTSIGSRGCGVPPQTIFYCHVSFLNRCWTNTRFDMHDRVSPAFVHALKRALGLRPLVWPSTGAVAIALALRLCGQVSLYGFASAEEAKVGFDSNRAARVARRECAKYYTGAPDACARRRPECRTHAPNATRASTGCTPRASYLAAGKHFYHDWDAEARWRAELTSAGHVSIVT